MPPDRRTRSRSFNAMPRSCGHRGNDGRKDHSMDTWDNRSGRQTRACATESAESKSDCQLDIPVFTYTSVRVHFLCVRSDWATAHSPHTQSIDHCTRITRWGMRITGSRDV